MTPDGKAAQGPRAYDDNLLGGDRPMDRTTVDKLLTTTRTVRKRLDLRRPVEPEEVQQMTAARSSVSAM